MRDNERNCVYEVEIGLVEAGFFSCAGFITIANATHSDCAEVEENGEFTNCCRN